MTKPISKWFNQLKCGDLAAVGVGAAQGRRIPDDGIFLPGSFNPLHEGHLRMAAIGEQLLGRAVAFEISIENADKPTLTADELESRVAQFKQNQPVWVTQCSTFVDKSRLFSNATFLVGVDTISRIANPRYYGTGDEGVQASIQRLIEAGSRFLVFGRVMGGSFKTSVDLAIPEELRSITEEVRERDFRIDISSSALRRE